MITFALHCRCDLVASKNSRTQNPEICCVQFHTETNINSQSNSLRTLPYGLGSPTLVRVCPHIYASCLSFIKTRFASLFILKLRKWLFLTVHSSSAHVQNRFIHDPVSTLTSALVCLPPHQPNLSSTESEARQKLQACLTKRLIRTLPHCFNLITSRNRFVKCLCLIPLSNNANAVIALDQNFFIPIENETEALTTG